MIEEDLAIQADIIIDGIAYFIHKEEDKITAFNLHNLKERFCFLSEGYGLLSSTIPPSETLTIMKSFIVTWEALYNG